MRHMWSRKAKIQPQMAVSGNADIFSIKVDSRLKTILFPTGVATEMNFNSVLFEKFTSSPKCRLRECSWRGIHKMPDQPKTPLKVGQSGWNFHRKLSLYQRINLYWAGQLEGHFKNFNFRGVGGGPYDHPQVVNVKYIIILPIWSPNLISCLF